MKSQLPYGLISVLNIVLFIYIVLLALAPSRFTGATCNLIKKVDNRNEQQAFIEITDKNNNSSGVLSVLIFKYTDLENFGNVPSYEAYKRSYKEDKQELSNDIIDPVTSLFNIQQRRKDDIAIYNGLLTRNETTNEAKIHWPIDTSGYYCVYMFQPQDPGSFKITINFHNSSGNLTYWAYVLQTQAKYVLILSGSVLLSLFCYIQRFKLPGEKLLNFDSISFITQIIIKELLSFFIVIQIGILVILYILNNYNFNRLNSLAFVLFELLKCFGVAILYYTGVVSRGSGIFVPYRRSSLIEMFQSESKLEVLGLFNIIFIFWKDLSSRQLGSQSPFHNNYSTIVEEVLYFDSWKTILATILHIFPIIWSLLIVKNLFETSKSINLHSYNQQLLLQSLKHTLLVVVGIPIITNLILLVILVPTAFKIVNQSTDTLYQVLTSYLPLFASTLSEEEIIQTQILKTKFYELLYLEPYNLISIMWFQYVNFLLVIGFMFSWWIKDNRGIPFAEQAIVETGDEQSEA